MDYTGLRNADVSSRRFFKNQVGAGDKVLDLGTKHGRKLEDVGGTVVAVDISDEQFRQQTSIVEFMLADGAGLPFESESFDYVYCDQVLEHVSDTKSVVSEAARVLKPEGLAYFGFPNRLSLEQPHSEVPRHMSLLPKPVGRIFAARFLDERSQVYYEKGLGPLSPVAARYHLHNHFDEVVYPMRIDPTAVTSSSFGQRIVWALNTIALQPPLCWLGELLWPAVTYVCASPKNRSSDKQYDGS